MRYFVLLPALLMAACNTNTGHFMGGAADSRDRPVYAYPVHRAPADHRPDYKRWGECEAQNWEYFCY